jgi:hypothetical protein
MFFKIPIDIPESVLVSEFFVTGGYKQGTQFAHQTGGNGITWTYFRQISQDVTYYKINNAN